MQFLIRRLDPEDVAGYRAIRLEALNFNAEMFGGSYSIEEHMPVELMESRLKRSIIFGGFEGEALQGIVGYFTMNPPKMRHKGVMFGLYVRPAARRHGLGLALVERVLHYAREKKVEQVQITVVAEDSPARRLFDKAGFMVCGTAPQSIKSAERYYDEELRVRFLNGQAAS
jgi:ribosomal protein S18 acetylase RimI-like enzyme